MNLFLRQFQGELVKLLARKRTYIGFGAFVLLETVLLLVFQLDRPQEWIRRQAENVGGSDGPFGDLFSALTFGFLVLQWSVFLMGALYLALVGGDIVAKEAEDGTLRMALSRPISRLRLLGLKYAAAMAYTFVLMFFIGGTCVVMGGILRGFGGGFLVIVQEQRLLTAYPVAEGYLRYSTAIAFLACSMTTVTSVAFFFSCLRIKPAAATILTLTALFADFVLEKIPPLEDYRDFFLTARMSVWVEPLRDQPVWLGMVEDYAWQAGVSASCFVIGWLIFQSRDFKT